MVLLVLMATQWRVGSADPRRLHKMLLATAPLAVVMTLPLVLQLGLAMLGARPLASFAIVREFGLPMFAALMLLGKSR